MLKLRWSIGFVLAASLVATGYVGRTPDPGTVGAVADAAMTAPRILTVPRGVSRAALHREPGGERVLARSLRSAVHARRISLAATPVELPGGGVTLFPSRRLVALYGHPNAPVLGVLGEQPLRASIRRAKRLAAEYNRVSSVRAVPAFELITTVASRSAGSDGNYSNEKKVRDLRPWVVAAGRAGVYVVLDLQPGRADFLTQAKRYQSLLVLPHVGLALDPEWRLKPRQVHLRQIGSVSAQEINRVTTWLADLTASRRLPQKLLLLHQFRLSMITNRERLDASRKEIALVIQMDGFGAPSTKLTTWRAIRPGVPKGIRFGWKNFYDEDRPTFTPKRTVGVRPSPVFVSYQ